MPTIPMDVQREVVQATPMAPMQSLADAGRVGQSLERLGSTADAFQNEQDARAAADTKLKLHTFAADFKETLAKDADYSTYETRYKDAVEKWKEQNVSGLTTGAKRMLGAGLDEAVAQGSIQVRHAARMQQVDQSKAEMMQSLDGARQGFGRAGGDMAAVLADGYKAIDARVEGGVLTRVEGERQRQAFRDGIADEQARMMYMADPRGFAKAIAEGKAEWLGGKERLIWQQRADAKVEALDAKAEREALKREREADRAEERRQRAGAVAAGNVMKIVAEGYVVNPDTRAAALEAARGTVAEADLKTTLAIEDRVSVRPIAEQRRIVEENDRRLQAGGVQDAGQIAMQKKLAATVERNAKAVVADPAGFSEKQGITQPWPALNMRDMQGSLAARVGLAMDVQTYHGLDYLPILRKQDADGIVQTVTSTKDPRERAGIVGALMAAADTDATATAMLGQLEAAGLPPEYRAAAIWAKRGDTAKAARIVSELQAGKEATKELKGPERATLIDSTRAKFNSGIGRVFDEAYKLTGDASFETMKQRAYSPVEQLALVRKVGGQDPDTALGDAAPYKPINRPGLAHILVPGDANDRDIVRGLETLRAQAPAMVAKLLPAEGLDPAARRQVERSIEDIGRRGTWVQHGNGYALYPSWGGRPVSLGDGRPWIVTLADIQAAGAGSTMAGTVDPQARGAATPPDSMSDMVRRRIDAARGQP